MARSLADIRRKIKATKSLRQVTKAMELVSASKMRRAVLNAQTLRSYALAAWEVLQKMAAVQGGGHPFLTERPVKKILVVLFTSDRGLCGGLNAQMFRTVGAYLRGTREIKGLEAVDFIAVGRKGQQFLTRTGENVIAAFPAFSNHPKFRDVLPMARMAIDGFRDGNYDHVVLLYTDFVSPLLQEPTVKVLLPFSPSELKEMIGSLGQRKTVSREDEVAKTITLPKSEYLFEPDPAAVLDRILPQLTEIQIYQGALETAASEHSARMVAMRNATDNATDVLADYTLTYNRSRQANITAELAELSASKAALD